MFFNLSVWAAGRLQEGWVEASPLGERGPAPRGTPWGGSLEACDRTEGMGLGGGARGRPSSSTLLPLAELKLTFVIIKGKGT